MPDLGYVDLASGESTTGIVSFEVFNTSAPAFIVVQTDSQYAFIAGFDDAPETPALSDLPTVDAVYDGSAAADDHADAPGDPAHAPERALGLAPLRGALRELVARPEDYPSVRLLYGARSPGDILYGPELLSWDRSIRFGPETVPAAARAGHVKVHVTVDRGGPGWTGHVGVVTTLMRRKPMMPHALYLLCGPEVMMRFVLAELDRAGVPAQNVWVSMERNMKCAAGLCGRCQYGPYFICKDGPVFRRDQLAGIFGREGF